MKNNNTVEYKTLKLFEDIAKVLSPPPLLTVSQWADRYRKLSPESAAEPGQWNTDRAPYQRAIMDAVNDPFTEEIVIMSSAQVGKTELLLNIIGYYIDYDPAPILVVQPNITPMGMDFSKDRLATMIRDTPTLAKKVRDAKSKTSGNTILHKTFPGGHITIAGANSAASLASRPIRIVLMDEIDRYPASAGSEGSPIKLAEKRTTTFWNKKKIKVSTPTIKGESQIEDEFLSGTMEEWCVPCPCCGRYQPYEWKRIQFSDVTMECKYCGKHISEVDWKQGNGKFVAAHPERHRKRSFHLNELASPWKHWQRIIDDWKEANEKKEKYGDINKLKTFINTSLGETWEERGKGASDEALLSRREHYEAELPEGVLVLTAAVDVQDDRFEIEVVGWGHGFESWGIKYQKLYGDLSLEETWERLAIWLDREFYFASGTSLLIAKTCIDTGHKATDCYKFLQKMQMRGKRITGIKGFGREGQGIPLLHKLSKISEYEIEIFILGVDNGKEMVVTRLATVDEGPGYCHFPINADLGYSETVIKGFNSEQRVTEFNKEGRPVTKWKVKSGIRNEPLDLRVYNTAAIEILQPNFDILEKKIKAGINYMKRTPQNTGKKRRTGVVSRGVEI